MSSWQLYEDDIGLARDIDANAFRFSISWSRVQPSLSTWNDEALQRYASIVATMRARGLEPVVTLFHYTHPTWFQHLGGWASSASVDHFVRFAARTARQLGRDATYYTIFNEPLVFLLAGYVAAEIPPGVSDATLARRAMTNLLTAHALAAAEIRKVNPGAKIGVAHNAMAFAPERRWHPLDRLLAGAADRFYNVRFPDAFVEGRWNLILPPATNFRGHVPELVGSLDFLGINFYSRLHLRCPGQQRFVGDFRYLDRSQRGLTDNGWEVVPDEFEHVVERYTRLGLPMMITENGIADERDAMRPQFIREHVDRLLRLRERGIDVRGYFYWSLLDNFEWLEGYGPKFGLYAVDRETMTRRPRERAITAFREMGAKFLELDRPHDPAR